MELTRRNFTKLMGAGAVLGGGTLIAGETSLAQAAVAAPTIQRRFDYGASYEVIILNPANLTKVESTMFNQSNANFIQYGQTVEERAKGGNYKYLINCDSYATLDGSHWNTPGVLKRPVGLQIVYGKAFQDFGRTHSERADSDLETLVMMKDGTFRAATRAQNKSAQQWVNEGAIWSAGYLPICLQNGVIRPGLNNTGRSARTIIGQRKDKTIVIITVTGKTERNEGWTEWQTAKMMQNFGCVIATNLDGGGSTQAYWKDHYIHPSSDGGKGRAVAGGYLAIQGVTPPDFR